jgi:hypothetical protein
VLVTIGIWSEAACGFSNSGNIELSCRFWVAIFLSVVTFVSEVFRMQQTVSVAVERK